MSDNILIIEDSDDDFEITELALRNANLTNHIIHCKSGNEALEFINDETIKKISIILLDLNMPGLHGQQVLKHLKSHALYKSVPLVILTTSNNTQDIEQCYLDGANSYIQKSLDFTKFEESMNILAQYWFSVATINEIQNDQKNSYG